MFVSPNIHSTPTLLDDRERIRHVKKPLPLIPRGSLPEQLEKKAMGTGYNSNNNNHHFTTIIQVNLC